MKIPPNTTKPRFYVAYSDKIVVFDGGSDGDFVDYSREDLLKKIDIT